MITVIVVVDDATIRIRFVCPSAWFWKILYAFRTQFPFARWDKAHRSWVSQSRYEAKLMAYFTASGYHILYDNKRRQGRMSF